MSDVLYLRLFHVVLIVMCLPITLSAMEWEGLSPAVSTRADLVRLFGHCSDKNSPCEFDFKGDQVRIVLSATIHNEFYQCTKTLPAETVLLIEVTPSRPIPLKTFRRSELKLLGSSGEFQVYINEGAGLVIKTRNGKVIQLNYVAAAADKHRCEDYYKAPINFVQVVTHCPPVTLSGPTGPVSAGEITSFKADVAEDPKMTLIWILNAGKIISESGRSISVDTAGASGQKIKVTVQAHGACSVESSFEVAVAAAKPPL
jgi:hypothetical protein